VNTKRRTITTAITALFAAAVSVVPAVGVDAAHRPSPDYNKRPKPAVVLAEVHHRPSPDFNKRPKPAAVVVAGYHHPAPDRNKMPKPSVVMLPCPAADDIPQCNLDRTSETVITDTSATALRTPTTASGGGGGTLSPTRMMPSPR
jgi:hypothetical protein